jgi:hypothetical protein
MLFLYFHLFFYIFLSAACRNKALFLYRTDVFLLTSKKFFRKNNHKCLEFCHYLAYLCRTFAEKYLNYD